MVLAERKDIEADGIREFRGGQYLLQPLRCAHRLAIRSCRVQIAECIKSKLHHDRDITPA